MRALRVVGFDGVGDNGVVILEDLGSRERFTVPADERLRAAARGDVLRLGQMSTDLESQLRPREIQARIRAGASVEQVAQAAGVPNDRIERFAYPVLLERSRYAELAQQAHPVREDGPDVRTLSEVVAHTFGLRGQEYTQAEWDSWRGDDNKWVVALRWSVGHSDITARWTYHPGAHGGTVTALDEHATDLIDGQLARPPRRVGPVIDFSKPEAEDEHPDTDRGGSGTPEGTAGPAARTGTTDASARAGTGSEARPGTAGSARTASGTSSTRSGTGPAGSTRTGTGRASTGRASTAKSGTRPEQPADAAPAPEPEDAQTGATDEAPAPATKRPRKGKPVMPSWEDVLLGVKAQR
jgi:hypothetical protein